jgi:alkanesulfonate monooxygenase SsuD/methylene tetrahydromethanopterin reductase-like flavin-dependent oxidoreductase (luciferase family)
VTQLSFGVAVTPTDDPIQLRLAMTADRSGLDLVAVQDHPYQPTHLEMWTYLGHLAAHTERISLLPDVADLALRPPALLAKAAASLDVLSGGRVELGVGAGGIPDAIAAFGGPRRTPGELVEAAAEALRVLRVGLDAEGDSSHLDGRFHRTGGYRPGPRPPHRIGLWVGDQRPRLLRVIGELADGWVSPLNIYVPPEAVPAARATIDRAATDAGRDLAAIRRIYNVIGTIDGSGGVGLDGSAEDWADTLAGWTGDLGFDTYVFWPAADPSRQVDQLERFAGAVVPRVRELVAATVSGR